jgi:hypothetical protein
MVFPFWFSCRTGGSCRSGPPRRSAGYIAAAGDAVGESPEGGYLQWVALVEGFVDGDVGEGPAVVEPERGVPQPGGLGLVQLVVDHPHQLLVDSFLAGFDGVAHYHASHC